MKVKDGPQLKKDSITNVSGDAWEVFENSFYLEHNWTEYQLFALTFLFGIVYKRRLNIYWITFLNQ